MPRKIDMDKTHAQKVITLFARLMFSDQKYSLTDISQMLNCSKQTVQRIVDNINSSYSVIIDEEKEGKQKYYRIKRLPRKLPQLGLTENEYMTLQMCKSFTKYLLGEDLFQEATCAMEKSSTLLENSRVPHDHFATLRPGRIDYTSHNKSIKTIIESMDKLMICKIEYHSLRNETPKSYHIIPLKLFSHQGTLYLHSRKVDAAGKTDKKGYEPLLAVHRIVDVELTKTPYEFPSDYNFEKAFNQAFGVMQGDEFEVEVIFTGFAAVFVSERIWDEDQTLEKLEDDSVRLKFTASSEPEVISWILSFDSEAEVIKPDWLRGRIKEMIEDMRDNYL